MKVNNLISLITVCLLLLGIMVGCDLTPKTIEQKLERKIDFYTQLGTSSDTTLAVVTSDKELLPGMEVGWYKVVDIDFTTNELSDPAYARWGYSPLDVEYSKFDTVRVVKGFIRQYSEAKVSAYDFCTTLREIVSKK